MTSLGAVPTSGKVKHMIKVTYQNGPMIEEDDPALTLLQISLKHGVPHVHDCGGNARCSTCRVMIHDGLENVLPRTEAETRLAAFKGFEADVRLACQTCIRGPVLIRRLVHDDKDAAIAKAEHGASSGCERSVAILFSDIRDFTPFAEANLPYDIVHMLNRYFLAMGDAVLEHGGSIDKYIGDGMLALFGVSEGEPRSICLAAVRAGLRMLDNLTELNGYLRDHFGVEFRMRIGIHFGDVVVGQMGHPKKMQFTAIGDSVNTANRIESAVRATTANLLVSDVVYAHIKNDVETGVELDAALKGKHGTYRLYEVIGIRAR
jgi:adenylate cyclase